VRSKQKSIADTRADCHRTAFAARPARRQSQQYYTPVCLMGNGGSWFGALSHFKRCQYLSANSIIVLGVYEAYTSKVNKSDFIRIILLTFAVSYRLVLYVATDNVSSRRLAKQSAPRAAQRAIVIVQPLLASCASFCRRRCLAFARQNSALVDL
jgi:hypothetical protein